MGVLILRAEAVGLQRCFGRLREAVVADRELVVVFRSGGYSVFKLRLKYKDNFYGKGKYCGARIIGIAEINFGFCI